MDAAGTFLTAAGRPVVLWWRCPPGDERGPDRRPVALLLRPGRRLLEPLNRLSSVNLKVQDALVAVDRLYQVLDLELEQAGGPRAQCPGVRDAIEPGRDSGTAKESTCSTR